MLSAQEEACRLQNARRTESLATQHGLEGLWPRRNLGRGCCSTPRPPAPSEPRAADTHPQAVTGRYPGQGRAAGLIRGDLLSWPLFPHKVVFLPPGVICRDSESWVCRVSAGQRCPRQAGTVGCLLGPGRAGCSGPPRMGCWDGLVGGGRLPPLLWCPESPVPESKPKEEGPGDQQAGLLPETTIVILDFQGR